MPELEWEVVAGSEGRVVKMCHDDITIEVRSWKGSEDVWFVTCHPFRIDRKILNASDVESAKAAGLVYVLGVANRRKAAVDCMMRAHAGTGPAVGRAA